MDGSKWLPVGGIMSLQPLSTIRPQKQWSNWRMICTWLDYMICLVGHLPPRSFQMSSSTPAHHIVFQMWSIEQLSNGCAQFIIWKWIMLQYFFQLIQLLPVILLTYSYPLPYIRLNVPIKGLIKIAFHRLLFQRFIHYSAISTDGIFLWLFSSNCYY